MAYERYVAIGDSLTEGKGDTHPDGALRGFADLLATAVAAAAPGAAYANMARPSVRLAEIARDQVPSLRLLAPDLVTVVGGINDVIALRFDAARVERGVGELLTACRAASPEAVLVTATLPDTGHLSGVARLWRARVRVVNQAIRDVAPALGITVVDLDEGPQITPAELALDRAHPSPAGHLRLARQFAAALGLEVPAPSYLAPAPRAAVLRRVYRTAVVAPQFLSKRLAREALIASRPAKRPDLQLM